MWKRLFDGAAHRPREGASVRGAAHDDYVRRRLTRAQIDGPLNVLDPVRAVRERLTWRSCGS